MRQISRLSPSSSVFRQVIMTGMNSMMGWMGAVWLLAILALVLGIAALIKYLLGK